METDSSLPVAVSSDTATRGHHKFGPSRLEYIDNCAAFTNRDNGKTEYSEEGQFLHDRMSDMLKAVRLEADPEVPMGKLYINTTSQLAGWVSSQYEISEEQMTWLRFCCKRVDDLILRGPVKLYVEIPIEVKNPNGTLLNHGYLDALLIFANGTAILIDWKFGWIPVPHASENLQGLNYTLAALQMFPDLNRVGVKFIQPKLNSVTEAIFDKARMFSYYARIRDLIALAQDVQDHPETAQTNMHPGPYCEYCALSGSCAMLANHRSEAAARYGMLPELPPQFPGMELATPAQWALARYWVDVIEKGLEEFKKRAKEIAEANGGELRCSLPTGEEVVYEIAERNCDRSLGDPVEIAEVLKEYVTLEQILACASLPVGAVLKIATDGMAEMSQATDGEKLTKKRAKELIESTLTAHGLLSTPNKKISFLKLQKGATAPVGAPPALPEIATGTLPTPQE